MAGGRLHAGSRLVPCFSRARGPAGRALRRRAGADAARSSRRPSCNGPRSETAQSGLELTCACGAPRPSSHAQAVVLEELAALKGAMAAEREERVAEDDEVGLCASVLA